MFKINRKIEYSLIALKHMSRKKAGQLTSAKEICHQHNIPFDPTSRVLQIMNQHGIVQGRQGILGGYRLKKDLSRISLKELSDMIVGPIRLTKCMRNKFTRECSKPTTCRIVAPMMLLNKKMNQLFDSITIRDLLQSKVS